MSKVFNDVKTFLEAVGQDVPPFSVADYSQSELYKSLIDEEYEEWITAWNQKDETEKADACFDMIWVIVGYMLSRGWNVDALWDEGAKSNLAKIDPETGKVIRRVSDGKILKPDGWKEPNFSQFVK